MEKIKIAEKRYEEMETRKNQFMADYKNTGNPLSLELANEEQVNMDKLIVAIMKAKKGA